MTEAVLLERLAEFIEEITKDRIYPVRRKAGVDDGKERAPNVYKMALPKKGHDDQLIPYIVLQVVTSKTAQAGGNPMERRCAVRIVFAIYDEDAMEGGNALLTLISAVEEKLLETQLIGGQFILSDTMETLVYPDNAPPYHMGEMMTVWKMPPIERQVTYG